MKHRSYGFTLIELLVVIAIVAILAALAVPSFNTLLVKRSVLSAASGLVSDMRLARSEALRRSAPVTVCSLAANSTNACSAGGVAMWTNGWLVFMDVNGDGVVDASDEIIRVEQPPPNMASIQRKLNPSNTLPKFTYQANGWAKAIANDTLVFTPRGVVPDGAVKCVVVSSSGRPSVIKFGDTGCT